MVVKMLKRGDSVLVHAYPDEWLERVVWEGYPSYVLVCRQAIYDEAIATGCEPQSSMGFPIEDIQLGQ